MRTDKSCARSLPLTDFSVPDNQPFAMDKPRQIERRSVEGFVDLVGRDRWRRRLSEIQVQASIGPRKGKAILGRHSICVALEKLRRGAAPSAGEENIAALAGEAAALARLLPPPGRTRLEQKLDEELTGANSLVPLFHLLRTARLQRERGFQVEYAGLAEGAPFDLLLRRDGIAAEVICDVFSAEDGRQLHRGAWFGLADRIDPDLQTWLAAHPGRYLLRVSLPDGLQDDEQGLVRLHERIREMLGAERRSEQDAACVLRLDRLLLAGAQANELGLLSTLRREFGPEAHLAVTTCGEGIFVMAARAGREDEIAQAVCRRMKAIAPARLTGAHPGILAMFIDDIERQEWRGLRDRLELEGEARQFLTQPEARQLAAVTFASRMELFGTQDSQPDGDLRFRNPSNKAARTPALSPAIASSV
jgi:hypothetical protein